MDPISLSLVASAATTLVESYLDDSKKGKLVTTLVGGVLLECPDK